jgi:hypothetical protein
MLMDHGSAERLHYRRHRSSSGITLEWAESRLVLHLSYAQIPRRAIIFDRYQGCVSFRVTASA